MEDIDIDLFFSVATKVIQDMLSCVGEGGLSNRGVLVWLKKKR